MTIAVGVACPEGLVLAADSRASMFGEGYARVATDFSHKVFDIGGRFGAVTFGWRFLETNTVAGVMEEFAAQTKLRDDVTDVAEKLRDYFRDRVQRHIKAGVDEAPPEGGDVLGFIVGGYDSKGIGHLKTVYLPSGDIIDGSSTAADGAGAHWQGDIEAILRLMNGFDMIRTDVSAWPEEQREALDRVAYLVPCYRMALQDAVDFACFVIRTTIDVQRFTDGTVAEPGGFATCGGPIELLTITGRGLAWLRRTTLTMASAASETQGSPV